MFKNLSVFLALPLLIPHAASAAAPKDFADFVKIFTDLIGALVPIVFAFALVVFFWGIAQFILSADDANKRTESKQIMIWGVIALFVMLSIWGIIGVLKSTFF